MSRPGQSDNEKIDLDGSAHEQPTSDDSATGEVDGSVDEDGRQNESHDQDQIQRTFSQSSRGPISKARAVALVATVTGASFLNASSSSLSQGIIS
jgi:hypothetical protein